MANSYNVRALPDYVDQNRSELIAKSVLAAKSAGLFRLMTGVKGATALNLIDTTVEFGDGGACGWNEAGETTLSQRVLNPAALKVNMGICDKNLLKKWANYLVRVEANKTDADLPFEQEFIDDVIKGVKAELEKMIWQGDSTGTGTQFDGIVKILSATGSGVHTVTPQGNTALAVIREVAAAMPAEVLDKDDAVIFVSMPVYNQYIQELVTANLYHYNPGDGENEYKLPGTTIRVIGVNGLNGLKTVVGGRLSNFVYGTNLEDGDEVFDLWYSKDNREFRLAIEFVAGVQVAYPSEVTMVATF